MTESIAIEIREALMAANEKFMAAFNQGNAAGLAALYTQNGQLLPAHSDFVTHQPAIQAFWQGAMDMGIKSIKLETLEAEDQGGTAYEVGKYTLQGEGGQLFDAGKYVVIWTQEDGQWKLHRDIWTSSLPRPAS